MKSDLEMYLEKKVGDVQELSGQFCFNLVVDWVMGEDWYIADTGTCEELNRPILEEVLRNTYHRQTIKQKFISFLERLTDRLK